MPNATIYLKGSNQMTQAVNGAVGDIKRLADGAQKTGKIFATAFGIGSAVAVIKKATSEVKGFFEAVDDPQLKSNIDSIKSTFSDIKTTIKDTVSYSIAPLVEQFASFFTGIKGNLENIVIYVAAVLKNLPTIFAKVISMMTQMLQRLFSWEGLKTIISTLFDNIVAVGGFALKAIFQSIPSMLWDLFSGIMLWLDSVAVGLTAKLIGAVEDFINKTQDKIANSWIGKLFGIDADKYIDLGKNKLLATQKNLKAQSQSAFAGIGSEATNLFHDFIDTAKEIGSNTAEAFDGLFGDILQEGIGEIAEGVQLTAVEMKTYVADRAEERAEAAAAAAAVVDATEDQTDATEKVTKELRTFLDDFGAKFGEWAGKFFGASSEQSSAFGGNVIGNLTNSLGEAGGLISELAQNMSTMGPILGAIATALKYVIEGFAESFGGILNEFVTYGIEPLRELGRVIGNLLKPIMEDIMPLVKDVGDFLARLFNAIGAVLMPIVRVLSGSVRPILDVISNVLEAFAPVLQYVAKCFTVFSATIEYIVQGLRHFVAVLFNWLAGLDLLGWRPFSGLKMSDPGSPGSYFDHMNNRLNSVDSAFSTSIGITSGTSASTAVSSAKYQGATSITINIYQEAPVVGDGGMRQFARMIHDEFDALSYYGVGA